ncbi:MAG: non-heme iron oxygenase ferredoxin subunit [Gammaproteobacteria bacterium]|nr:non-heme iron oxygenase ferredoxin subunit [Gammaproteobacteria bacterium]
MSDWIDVGAVDDIAPGGFQLAHTEDTVIAVFNIDGEFHAMEDICSHDYVSLTDGGDICGEEIVCARHGACFNIKTGEALTPPAYESVPVFPVRIVDGIVQTRDDRFDDE